MAADAFAGVAAGAAGELRVSCATVLRAEHALVGCGPVPTALTPDGVYPYASFAETAARPALRRLRVVTLENALLSAEVCPDLGGKLVALRLRGGSNVLADPGAVRPVRILPRGAFVGGGIEVSFPISHTPSLLERVCVSGGVRGGRARVCVGERELRCGMQWSVEWSLGAGEAFLRQRTRFRNATPRAHRWMSWANAGVPCGPDTELLFPGGPVLVHGDEMAEIADWAAPGAARPRRQGDIRRMTAFFWRKPTACAFGVFTPSVAAAAAVAAAGIEAPVAVGDGSGGGGGGGIGLFHSADPAAVGGMKLWSDGVGEHEPWVSQYMTDAREQLLEVQAGPLPDQSVKDVLEPGAERRHSELWWPAAERLDLEALAVAAAREAERERSEAEEEVPLFGWARPETVRVWLAVEAAHAARDARLLPPAPPQDSNDWPPSGMDALGAALAWAAGLEGREDSSRWAFLLGAWIAGRIGSGAGAEEAAAGTAEAAGAAGALAGAGSVGGAEAGAADARAAEDAAGAPPPLLALAGVGAALTALAASDDGRAHALAGRLLRRARRDCAAAAASYRRISEPALALHPQVVVERDLALAGLGGAAALAERRSWLARVSALADEGVAERRAALLLDEGRPAEARALLEGARWTLVHQRYARSRLWRRAVAALEGAGAAAAARPPACLGEDELAKFGAYVEHPEDEAFE